jgi:hypothetical protein
MDKSLVEFLHDRPVPYRARCEHRTGRCESHAMMLVRVEGQERFFCYDHVSLLYARVTRPRDSHPKIVRLNVA